jgi:hypothetical protein
MGEITLWLNVYERLCPMGASELWTKKMRTDFPPRRGDDVHLWPEEDPEDGQHGLAWTVSRHFWGADGSYDCELTYMVVDPDEKDGTQGQQAFPSESVYLYSRAWWTDRDGRPEPELRRGGWIRHGETRP